MLNRIGPSALGVPWPKRLGKQTPLRKLVKTKLQKDFELKSHKAAVARLEKQLRDAMDKQYFSSSLQPRTSIDGFILPTADAITEWFTSALKGRATTTTASR